MKIKGNIENKGKDGKGWWLKGVVAKGGGGGGATAILKRNIQKESTMLISKYSSS